MIGIGQQIAFIEELSDKRSLLYDRYYDEYLDDILVSLREHQKCIRENGSHVIVEMPHSTVKAYQDFLSCKDLPALLSAINTTDMNNNSTLFNRFKQKVTIYQLEQSPELQKAFRWLQDNKSIESNIPDDIRDILNTHSI